MQEFIQNNSTIIIVILLLIIVAWAIKWWLDKVWWSLSWYKVIKYFFTPAEKEFYTLLRKILYSNYKYKYDIFPKVRLVDIFKPTIWKKGISKIIQKHVDYLIVDREQDFRPVLWIELDGDHSKQAESDKFKKDLYESCWLPLLRFKNSDSDNYRKVNYGVQEVLWTPIVEIQPKQYVK